MWRCDIAGKRTRFVARRKALGYSQEQLAERRGGVRLGKGAGYSDIEMALLQEAGLIGPSTTIVTTVHRLQVVDEPLPEMCPFTGLAELGCH